MTEMNFEEIEAMLNEARIGRLCMASASGRPYAIPLPFCWLDGSIYLRLPLSGRKGAILLQNDQVCFEVDAYTDTLDEYGSVLVEGRLITVEDFEEKGRVRQANQEKYQRLRKGYRPGHGRSSPLPAMPLRKIEVRQLSGRKKSPEPAEVELAKS